MAQDVVYPGEGSMYAGEKGEIHCFGVKCPIDINYRRKTLKNANIWKLNKTLLNNQQITEEIKKEIKICIETNENENTTTQNLWDTVKTMLGEGS